MQSTRATIWLATIALLLGGAGGCARFSVSEKMKLPGSDDKPKTPLSMTTLWTDTVLVEAGVNGFGGRILFYAQDKEVPIKVDGELTVFAYDDTSELPEENVPARKYVFRAEELEKHYSESTLGHSYSFWIPWDKVGGPQKQISLIARFKSARGGVVMSEMTRHLLPGSGPESPKPEANANTALAARMALEQAKKRGQTTTNSKGIATTTITLPEALGASTGAAAAALSQEVIAEAPPAESNAPRTPKTRADSASSEATHSDLQALVQELRESRQQREAPADDPPLGDRFARRPRPARTGSKSLPTHDRAPR